MRFTDVLNLRQAKNEALGFSGTEFPQGYDEKDYKTAWNNTQRYDTVKEMKMQDGYVYAGLNSWKLLMNNVDFFIKNELPTDDPKFEQAEEIKKMAKNTVLREFNDNIRFLSTFIEYGFSVFAYKYF